MEQHENLAKFHIGMRNVKTCIAVIICLGIYRFLNISGSGSFFASSSAVICMQANMEKSFSSGLNRVLGTIAGALIGMGMLYLDLALPELELSVILASAGIMLLIAILNFAKQNDSIIMACMVLLSIVLRNSNVDPFWYSVYRLLDTLVGIVTAILINRFILNPDSRLHSQTNQQEETEGTTQLERQILQPETEPTTDKKDFGNPCEDAPVINQDEKTTARDINLEKKE